MTLNLHALVRDFGIRHSGISLHCLEWDSNIEWKKVWRCTIYLLLCDGSKQCGIPSCYTLVYDVDQRLHPTLFLCFHHVAVYNECIPYCVSPPYRRHTPLLFASLLISLYGSKRVQF